MNTHSGRILQQGAEAVLYLYGDITAKRWENSDVSAYSLATEIEKLSADVLHVHIDSLGGEVKEGWAIYNALRSFKGDVITYADGFVASAAVYPFLAGAWRIANSVSAFFLHDMMMETHGNAAQLRRDADALEKLGEIGVQAFVEAAGMDAETVKELQRKEVWLTPQQAKEYGIATELSKEQTSAYTQSLRRKMIGAIQTLQQLPGMQQAADKPEKQQTTASDAQPESPAQRENKIKKMFS